MITIIYRDIDDKLYIMIYFNCFHMPITNKLRDIHVNLTYTMGAFFVTYRLFSCIHVNADG